jgi:molecular chaperone HscB
VASPSSSNAFELLGLPKAFDLDPNVIEQAFFARSKDLHPDRFATAPAAERVAALSRSRALNDAYQVVKRPVARAELLLRDAGITIGDNERLDPEFLGRVLELREELAEAKAGKDKPRIETLRAAMIKRRGQVLAEVTELFRAGTLDEVKHRLIALRYVDRYIEECDIALDQDD